MDSHFILLDGAINFRDFGGYQGLNGRNVKEGVLFRSDHLGSLSKADIKKLESMQINTVIDYRSDLEIENTPDIYPADYVYQLKTDNYKAEEAAKMFQKDIHDENKMLVEAASKMTKTELASYDEVFEMYRELIENPVARKSYHQLIKILIDPKTKGSVQHCRGGKDRTGVGCAIVLYLLGVAKEDIIYDYTLTAEARKSRNEKKMQQYRMLTDNNDILNYLYSLIDAKPEFISEAFNVMISMSGSIDSYISDVLHITQNEINKLQDRYLV